MDYDTRIRALKILTPLESPDKIIVNGFIREAERRFQYKDSPPIIHIREMEHRSDWDWLFEHPESPDWKEVQDQDWREHWTAKMILIKGTSRGMKVLESISKGQTRQIFDVLKRNHKIPLLCSQAVVATAAWVITGYGMYDLMPWGENPYEPLLSLMEAGYIARRVKTDELDEWRVGFIDKMVV